MDGNRKSQMKRSRKGQEGRDKSQRGGGISPRKGAVLSLCLLETLVSVLLLLFLDLTVNCY